MSGAPLDLDALIGSVGSVANVDPRTDIEQRLERLATATHYEVLKVAPDVDDAGIRAAFKDHTASFHPAWIGPELRDLREQCFFIYARGAAALASLLDGERRATYDAEIAADAAPKSEHSRVFGAAKDLERAESALKDGDVRSAERRAAAAIAADPEMPAYLVALATAFGQRGPAGTSDANVERALEMLDAVVAHDGSFDRALVAKGRLLRRSGRLDEAKDAFERTLKINPENADATRELAAQAIPASRTPTGRGADAPKAASATAGRRKFTGIHALGILFIAAMGVGYAVVQGLPTEQNHARDLLSLTAIDWDLELLPEAVRGPLPPPTHEADLDALGVEGVRTVVGLLDDPTKVHVGGSQSGRTMRESALRYLLRLADRVGVLPPKGSREALESLTRVPPPGEGIWAEQKASWNGWVDVAVNSGAIH